MITIEREGDAIRPHLRCGFCRQSLALKDAWLGFPPLEGEEPSREGIWGHRRCFDGAAMRLFARPAMLQWSARVVLEHLLRE